MNRYLLDTNHLSAYLGLIRLERILFGGGQGFGIAVRTERYRYVEYQGGKGGAMLFDEQNDPHEMNSLADDPQFASVRAELSTKCKQLTAGSKK